MNVNTCYYKLVVLQVNNLETTIHTEKHFGTLSDADQVAATYKEQGLVTILLRIWQNNVDIAV